jgi:hypothetical protein
MATNPFAPKKTAAQKQQAATRTGSTVKIAGSKNMTNKQVKAAGTSGFSFKGSGRSQAYIAGAKAALKGGATAAQAHRAGSAADSAAYTGA